MAVAKEQILAHEELPRKKNGVHMYTDQPLALLTESSSEFTERSLPDRSIFSSAPAAILYIGFMTVELYEGISVQMLETILKAMQSC